MRRHASAVTFALLLIAAVALVAILSIRIGFRHDFSYGQRASLGPQSVQLLRSLDGPVEVVSYASEGGRLRAAIAEFVGRYQAVKPDVVLRFVDPDADPAAMRARGVRIDGELDITYRDRSERLKLLNEREFSNTLLRLSRKRTQVAAFLVGNGERRADGNANADFAAFGEELVAQGVRPVPLALGAPAHVPDNTDLLVIADPRVALDAGVLDAIVEYVARGGALLWLVEPDAPVGIERLERALSVHVLDGVAVDGGGAEYGIGDPSFVTVTQYPPHAATRQFGLTVLLPQAAALAQISDADWQFAPLVRTGAQSWTESGAIPKQSEGTIRYDPADGELRGPLDLAFALTRLSPRPGRAEQRVAVIGDADFLSNSFLGNGGNREFGLRVVNWLLADDALIDVPDRTAPDRELAITATGLTALGFGFLVALPLLLLAIGGMLWWRRRRR